MNKIYIVQYRYSDDSQTITIGAYSKKQDALDIVKIFSDKYFNREGKYLSEIFVDEVIVDFELNNILDNMSYFHISYFIDSNGADVFLVAENDIKASFQECRFPRPNFGKNSYNGFLFAKSQQEAREIAVNIIEKLKK